VYSVNVDQLRAMAYAVNQSWSHSVRLNAIFGIANCEYCVTCRSTKSTAKRGNVNTILNIGFEPMMLFKTY